ncbi:MAG: hypothetical protein U0694_24670 [Anaerolineae bacterium]
MVKASPWMDRLSLIFSLVVVAVAGVWVWQQGVFSVSLTDQTNVAWYLVRASGVTAYALLTASMVWGIVLTSRVIKDWSPGVVSMLMHSTISWLAVVFSIVHALLLLFDTYVTYTVADIVIPFVGPYRPLAVGLGTLACWIVLIVSASFAFRKYIGHRIWWLLHLTSYASFALVTLHVVFAGTDAARLGFKALLVIGVMAVVGFLVHRLWRSASHNQAKALETAS